MYRESGGIIPATWRSYKVQEMARKITACRWSKDCEYTRDQSVSGQILLGNNGCASGRLIWRMT